MSKVWNKSKIISIVLMFMFVLAGIGFQTRPEMSFADVVVGQGLTLSDVKGYSSNGNTYNYVYFGEYPQTRVLKQKSKVEGEQNYGTYTADSESVHATIKNYIKSLNENYYKVYLPANPTNPFYSMGNPSYVWTDDAGTTTQIQNFYPQEDFENDNISFNYRSGYYTLKVAVTAGAESYPAGT
ncbi:MAG: hypothetical protein EOM05_11175, partial [Clostridia bacterium]|nr:hypothetical protein [Clostridia bacterium]